MAALATDRYPYVASWIDRVHQALVATVIAGTAGKAGGKGQGIPPRYAGNVMAHVAVTNGVKEIAAGKFGAGGGAAGIVYNRDFRDATQGNDCFRGGTGMATDTIGFE
jgi:hypothetical protein